jgi:hypothetical protein
MYVRLLVMLVMRAVCLTVLLMSAALKFPELFSELERSPLGWVWRWEMWG